MGLGIAINELPTKLFNEILSEINLMIFETYDLRSRYIHTLRTYYKSKAGSVGADL